MRDWPLIGRRAELSAIIHRLRQTARPSGAVLAGVAGVGKTRLAREALSDTKLQGCRTHWIVAAESSRHLPLGAFALTVGDVGRDPLQVLQRAAGALLAGPDRQTVIVVDDAHLLDDTSACLVQQMVTQHRATVLLTLRSGEPAPDAIASLWKDGYLDRIEIQQLTLEATTELLTVVLGGTIDPSSAERLHELSGGNALYLRQIVAGELAAAHFIRAGNEWRWQGRLALSAALKDLLTGKMSEWSNEVCELIDTLALGGPLAPATIAQLVPSNVVEEAEALGLVRWGDEVGRPQVRLEHPLYGEVRMTRLGDARARRLRGAIAEALRDTAEDDSSLVLRRAALHVDSDLAADVNLLIRGSQAALRLSDTSLAKRLAVSAVEAGGGYEARLTLSYVLAFGLEPEAADEVLAALVEEASDDLQRLRAVVPRAGHMFFEQGHTAQARIMLEQERQVMVDSSLLPMINGLHSVFLAMSGEARDALAFAEAVLAVGPLPPLIDVCVHWARVSASSALGSTDLLGEADIRAHEAVIDSYESCMPRLGFGEQHLRALEHAGRVFEARDLADRLCPKVASKGVLAAMLECLTGFAQLACGQVRSARETAERCVDQLRGADTSGCLYVTLMLLAISSAMSGDAPAARTAAESMDRERHPGYTVVETDRILVWAWIEAAEGATSVAIDRARSAAAFAAELGHWGSEAYALALATRFGDDGAAARLAALSSIVDGPRVRAAALQARGLAAADGELLIEAADRFEQMGDLASAADAAAQAATCFASKSLRSAHISANSTARRLQDACQAACTPALTAVRLLPLTIREREIVTLAAAGLSNREIAARLVVSVRTVEGHLYRAGDKLGTADRRRFAALLHADPVQST